MAGIPVITMKHLPGRAKVMFLISKIIKNFKKRFSVFLSLGKRFRRPFSIPSYCFPPHHFTKINRPITSKERCL